MGGIGTWPAVKPAIRMMDLGCGGSGSGKEWDVGSGSPRLYHMQIRVPDPAIRIPDLGWEKSGSDRHWDIGSGSGPSRFFGIQIRILGSRLRIWDRRDSDLAGSVIWELHPWIGGIGIWQELGFGMRGIGISKDPDLDPPDRFTSRSGSWDSAPGSGMEGIGIW